MQPDPMSTLRESLEALADVLDGVSFVLPAPDGASRDTERAELVRSIREYLLPRLRDPDAPVVAALLGPTGSGKSTLINSLAQASISNPGVVRPSTTTPVVWAHRDHARRYWAEFVSRVRERAGASVAVVVGDDSLTRDLTLIDTPPFDFVSAGRVVSQEVLSVTDLCVFVTSVLRYADGDAWDFIRHAQRRGLPILFVVNRLPAAEDERRAILTDYASRLAEAGLLIEADEALLFAVPEQELDPRTGALPPGSVATLRRELAEFADAELRHELVVQATEGAVIELADHARRIASYVEDELKTSLDLLTAVEDAYTAAARRLVADLSTVAGEPDSPERVVARLAAAATRRAGQAAQAASVAWAAGDTGARLLEAAGRTLWRHGPGVPDQAEDALETWLAGLRKLAADRAPRRLRRRVRRRVASALANAAIHDMGPEELVQRRLGDGAAAAVAAARSQLLGTLQNIFATDAGRFAATLGDVGKLQTVAATIASETAIISEAAEALHI